MPRGTRGQMDVDPDLKCLPAGRINSVWEPLQRLCGGEVEF